MSEIHLRQIKSYLEKTFSGLIDLSDYQNKSETDRELLFLTRSLANFALMVLANISPQEASKSICEGRENNAISSIYYDKKQKIMYILQSKWRQYPKVSIKTSDVIQFIRDFKYLLNGRYENLNLKFNSNTKDIEEALNDAGTSFEIVVIYPSTTLLAYGTRRKFYDLLNEMNDPTDIARMTVFNQSSIYKIIRKYALLETVKYKASFL